MPRRSALLIANQKSRRCALCIDEAHTALRAADIDFDAPPLPEREHLTELITQHAPGHDLVIVMGGDGTVNAALAGVLASGLPMAILPAGTANDLARTLGLPTDTAGAVGVIAAGNTKAVDVATVNGAPFLNAASLGLTARITQQLTRDLKRRWGVIAYLIACVRALVSMRRFGATIQVDDGSPVTVRSVQLVVGNGRYFGSGMTVDETAAIDDGVLHGYSVNAPHWWSLLTLFPALRRGTHAKVSRVHNVVGHHITVRTKRPQSISADGEIIATTPAEFAVQPAALRVFVPRT